MKKECYERRHWVVFVPLKEGARQGDSLQASFTWSNRHPFVPLQASLSAFRRHFQVTTLVRVWGWISGSVGVGPFE